MVKSNIVFKITMLIESTFPGESRYAVMLQISDHILIVFNVKRECVIKFKRQIYKREVKHAHPVK